jgi:hypothetical protein
VHGQPVYLIMAASRLYVFMVVALMFVMPIGCTIFEVFQSNQGVFAFSMLLKWFVFWAVGVRLLVAGLRQIIQPRYTAEVILGIKSEESRPLVREIGFGNTAIGCIAAGTLMSPGWLMPAAIAGSVFYSLAGVNHFLRKARTRNENIAMVSDVMVAVVLIVCLLPS